MDLKQKELYDKFDILHKRLLFILPNEKEIHETCERIKYNISKSAEKQKSNWSINFILTKLNQDTLYLEPTNME